MIDFVIFTFWGSVLLVFWTYFGYLIMLKFLSLFAIKDVKLVDQIQPVTIVITAYNEEKRISEKLENSLKLDYPHDLLTIIVVSDGSTDNTNKIVTSFENKGIILLPITTRQGKHYAQGRGIDFASSEIVILTDATTFLREDAVKKIVRNFADPSIGVVSGVDIISQEDNNPSGEGVYVRYEMKLRELEAKVGSLIGASGCFFAIRKPLAEGWIDNMSSDFYIPILAYMKGYRTVLDSEAIGLYKVLSNPDREFDRKVRTVLHGLEVLFRFKGILNPFKYGFYSIQIISHKLMRWLVPFALVVIFISSLSLSLYSPFFQVVLLGQILLYTLALIGKISVHMRDKSYIKLPFFFAMVNISIIIAWIHYLAGKKQVVWEATKR